MGWVYLGLSLLGVALAFNTWRPATGRGNAISFLVGWPYAETALHQIAIQLVITLGFAAAGAFESLPGQLGLALALGSWTSLVVHWQSSHRAGDRVEAALARSFGADYRRNAYVDIAGVRAPLREGLDWARIAWPFSPRRGRAVHREIDIPFARHADTDLHLDVYRPLDGGGKRPVLFQIHGGGWSIGTKDNQALPLIHQMVAQGWVCVATSYRLSPAATFPEHLIDCKRALAWVREHIAEHGGDPDFVVATGGSAGGHLCTLLTLTPNDPEYQPGFEDADTRVQGCVSFYGVYDFTDRNARAQNARMAPMLAKSIMKVALDEDPDAYRRASPMSRLHADAPPFLIVHGDADSLVSVEDARVFAELLEKESRAPVVYLEIAGAQHAFEMFESVRCQHAVNAAERFCNLVYHDHALRRWRAAQSDSGEGASSR